MTRAGVSGVDLEDERGEGFFGGAAAGAAVGCADGAGDAPVLPGGGVGAGVDLEAPGSGSAAEASSHGSTVPMGCDTVDGPVETAPGRVPLWQRSVVAQWWS